MDFRVVARRPSTGTARVEQLRVLAVQIGSSARGLRALAPSASQMKSGGMWFVREAELNAALLRRYLVVYLLAALSDWLQGPYVYALCT